MTMQVTRCFCAEIQVTEQFFKSLTRKYRQSCKVWLRYWYVLPLTTCTQLLPLTTCTQLLPLTTCTQLLPLTTCTQQLPLTTCTQEQKYAMCSMPARNGACVSVAYTTTVMMCLELQILSVFLSYFSTSAASQALLSRKTCDSHAVVLKT